MDKTDKIIEYLKQWKQNPLHWSNNKRRIAGLPVLRGKSNIKDRFLVPQLILTQLVMEALDEEVNKYIENSYKNLVDVNNITIGDKHEYKY